MPWSNEDSPRVSRFRRPIAAKEMPKMSILDRLARQLSGSDDLKPFQPKEHDR